MIKRGLKIPPFSVKGGEPVQKPPGERHGSISRTQLCTTGGGIGREQVTSDYSGWERGKTNN